jgi:hypothetical protein
MRNGSRAGLAGRVFLTVAALAPYWPLLTLRVIFVTDGHFTSDIFNGELPGRILVSQWIRAGHLPLWTSQLCSGYPLIGAPADPLGLALFTLLPPAPALDVLLIVLLLVAAHGTYSLARRFGADRSGAVLAGLGFAGSGYIATQLQHLSIMSTIVWLPVGLLLIDRVLEPAAGKRGLLLATLGLVYANQVLAGFPQAAHICGLVYGSFALFRALSDPGRRIRVREWLPLVGGVAGTLALGAAAGAVVLFPLAELTSLTDRAGGLDFKWATYTNFWPPNIFSFFVPYIYGDGSNLTYIGPPPFWEQYGYVGAATAILAVYGAGREWRRPQVAFLIVLTITALAFILGPHTPVYYLAHVLVPGMSRFRAPTRFMVVLELGLVLLAAVGLTKVGAELKQRWNGATRLPRLIQIGVCVATALDLFIHQPRQNAFVPASQWLAAPRTATIVRADTAAPRTYTPHHRAIHRRVHDREARGWSNVEPYFTLRDILQPNIGGAYWNVPSADCYVGLAPRWFVAVWAYHYYESGLIDGLTSQGFEDKTLFLGSAFLNLLPAYGVTHVLSPFPGRDSRLDLVAREADVYVYRVEGAARARIVRAARRVPDDARAADRLRQPDFNPDNEIVLVGAPDSIHPTAEEATDGSPADATGRATITHEDGRQLVVDAVAPRDGFLLLADMYYPGWRAEVDGVATPIYRANISLRGIALPKGQHTVRFTYDPSSFFRGLWVTLIALTALLLWFGAAAYRAYA